MLLPLLEVILFLFLHSTHNILILSDKITMANFDVCFRKSFDIVRLNNFAELPRKKQPKAHQKGPFFWTINCFMLCFRRLSASHLFKRTIDLIKKLTTLCSGTVIQPLPLFIHIPVFMVTTVRPVLNQNVRERV